MAAFHAEINFDASELGFRTHTDESGGGTRHADAVYWLHMFSGRGTFQYVLWASLLVVSLCWQTLN